MKTFYLLLMFLPLALISNEISSRKCRIHPHQIWLNESGIFIENSNGNWIKTTSLYQDAEGLYTFDKNDPNTDLGIAWVCGKLNSWSDKQCWNCGNRR